MKQKLKKESLINQSKKNDIDNLIITNNNKIKQNNKMNINPEIKPFISLSSLSKCQCCNIDFNGDENLPILFKCNHFFCKKCIETFFYEEGVGIKCPIDGLIAKSFDELVILNKLIEDDLFEQNNQNENNENIIDENQNYNINTNDNKETENYEINSENFCSIHPNQILTHYVEDTRELICAFCAFNRLNNNPKIIIKEINEKLNEYINDIENILDNNQKYASSLQNILNEIQINKENEENKVSEIYDQLITYLVNNRNVCLSKIDDFFKQNTQYISNKLDYFAKNIEDGEKIKEELIEIANQPSGKFNQVIDKFNTFIRDINNNSNYDLNINQYKFVHDDENKVIKYLNNFADLKNKKKLIKFNINNNINSRTSNNNNYNNTNNILTSESSQKDGSNFPTMNNNVNQFQFKLKKNNFVDNFDFNDNISSNINATLNKYITPSNYKKKTFGNENEDNIRKEDTLATLNKYNIPSKKI